MTNKELIEKLQDTLYTYGEVPVDIDYAYSDTKENNALVRDVLANKDGVTIYNY